MSETPMRAFVYQVSAFHGRMLEILCDETLPEELRFLMEDAMVPLEAVFDEVVRLEPDAPWWIVDQPTP